MRRSRLDGKGFVLGLLLVLVPGTTLATLNCDGTACLLVGFKRGGGVDNLQARYFASRSPLFIPRKFRIILTSLPAKIDAKSRLWKAKPNGLTLCFVAPDGIATLFEKTARLTADKFKRIGVHTTRDQIWLVRGDQSYTPIEECPTKRSWESVILAMRGSYGVKQQLPLQ